MAPYLPEEAAVMACTLGDLPDAPADVREAIGMGLVRALHLVQPAADFLESVESGLTESYEAFCARMTARKEGTDGH